MSDVIAAVATGNVVAAIGIVRLSGDGALQVIDRVFRPRDGKAMSAHGPRQLVLGQAVDGSGCRLDECLCTVSPGPGSYTGEDTAELQCHGSPTALRLVLEALFAAGARQAKAGEFTRRAFLNGRMDLIQAEAVIDLIDAETAECAKNAAAQLGGAVSRRLEGVYNALADLASHYYAVIDYPDEDIEPFELSRYKKTMEDSAAGLDALLSTFSRGRVLREGVAAAIIGRPNAGKSSLLNALLGYERAIVTSVPGTTRDTIEEKLCLGGVLLRLTDTAGLRRAGGEAERMGVRRALAAAEGAELVIAVFDGSCPLSAEDDETLAVARRARRAVALVSKTDLGLTWDVKALPDIFSAVIPVCAITGEGLDDLESAVAALFPMPSAPAGEIITNARQADAVGRALAAVSAAIAAMGQGMTSDAVLTDCESAMAAIGELTGRSVTEDVTERIFSRFCVGK